MCWASILSSLSLAAQDPRLSIRCQALLLLQEALLDTHSQSVGGSRMGGVLVETGRSFHPPTHPPTHPPLSVCQALLLQQGALLDTHS